MFKSKVEPFLKVSHLTYEIKKSELQGHIVDIMASINFNEFDEFIGVGGDGTLYEVSKRISIIIFMSNHNFSLKVQGIFVRKDWKEGMKKVIGIIPCGTGNGLSVSLGMLNTEEAAFSISKGNYKSLDISSVIQKGKRYYSFLSLTWAIIADVDLGGDAYRWLGPLRVPLTGVKCILENKTYDAILKYVSPKPESIVKKDLKIWNSYNINSIETYSKKFIEKLNKKEGPNIHYLNECFKNDLDDLNFKNTDVDVEEEEEVKKEVEEVEEEKQKEIIVSEIKQEMKESIDIIGNQEEEKKDDNNEVKDESDTIEKEEDTFIKYKEFEILNENSDNQNFTAFIGQNVPNLSSDFKTCKDIHEADGLWNIMILKGGLSRMKLIKIQIVLA